MSYLDTFITDTESEIKTSGITFAVTVAGVLFATPMIQPMISSLPGFSSVSGETQRAILAGLYAAAGQFFQGKWFTS